MREKKPLSLGGGGFFYCARAAHGSRFKADKAFSVQPEKRKTLKGSERREPARVFAAALQPGPTAPPWRAGAHSSAWRAWFRPRPKRRLGAWRTGPRCRRAWRAR